LATPPIVDPAINDSANSIEARVKLVCFRSVDLLGMTLSFCCVWLELNLCAPSPISLGSKVSMQSRFETLPYNFRICQGTLNGIDQSYWIIAYFYSCREMLVAKTLWPLYPYPKPQVQKSMTKARKNNG
tara:strand:- start:207 stop:593 length:387 start_codon:yes stop_codon:yes gene_type:complete